MIALRGTANIKIVIQIPNPQKREPSGNAMTGKPGYWTPICLLMLLFSLHWQAFALQPSEPSIPISVSVGDNAGKLPGDTPVVVDVDGDKQRDVVSARLVGGRYKIIVALSSRSDVITLSPPVGLAGFKIHVCDINKDTFQDIIVTTPTLAHQLAVWLGNGRGGFELAVQGGFETERGMAQPTRCGNGSLPTDQDLLGIPSHPVCEKMSLAFANPALDANGFVLEHSRFIPFANEYRRLTLRSPPCDPLV